MKILSSTLHHQGSNKPIPCSDTAYNLSEVRTSSIDLSRPLSSSGNIKTV